MRPSRFVIAATLLLATVRPGLAGERENIRGIAMARTFVASSRGLDAVGINPANLGWDNGHMLEFDIIPVSVHAGSNFLNYDLYTTYFTGVETDSGRIGRYLTDRDKRQILDAFPNGKGLMTMNVDARVLGVALRFPLLGSFALTVSEHGGGMVNIPKEYLALLFYGNPPGSSYNFSGTDVHLAWTREYALSYGRTLPHPPFLRSLAGGISLKLVHGFAYYDIERFDASLTTASNGMLTGMVNSLTRTAGIDAVRKNGNGDYSPLGAPAGSGVGLDLGVAAELTEYLKVGMSMTDIGSLTWSSNVEERSTDTMLVVDDLFLSSQQDAVDDALAGKIRPVNSFSSPLPTRFRLGFELAVDKLPALPNFPGELTVVLDYNQGLHDSYASTVNPRVSLGAEYVPVGWLPIRSGVSFGGTDGVNMAFGFGLDFGTFRFDLASEDISWVFDTGAFSYASLALGMRVQL